LGTVAVAVAVAAVALGGGGGGGVLVFGVLMVVWVGHAAHEECGRAGGMVDGVWWVKGSWREVCWVGGELLGGLVSMEVWWGWGYAITVLGWRYTG